jgi:hypothetical protein
LLFLLLSLNLAQGQTTREQKKFWKQVRKDTHFKKVFKHYAKYRFEIIYTRIEHDPVKGNRYHRYYFGDHNQYFYPASTVKFPMALKVCQKTTRLENDSVITNSGNLFLQPADFGWCNASSTQYVANRYLRVTDSLSTLNAAAMGGLNRETFCRINHLDPFKKIGPGKYRISTGPERPSLNEMMCEMLLYSNNHYFNELFELGASEKTRIEKPGIDVHKRLMVCNNADSAYTCPLYLWEGHDHHIDSLQSEPIGFGKKKLFEKGYVVGKKYYDFNSQLVPHGRDFSWHNQVKLEVLQDYLAELIFPGYLPEGTAYEITGEQRRQLIRYMGMRPSEDKIVSDSNYLDVPDDMTNFLYTGQSHEKIPGHLRMVNIIGQAYGFVTDCAYFADEKNKVDYFLAARIYVNEDEVLNDDKYEYETIAYPLMEQLGRIIYRYELTHPLGSGALSSVFQIF